jgi:hypothetical protein
MSWRININESNYSDARLLAWDKVLPYTHLPILDSDRKSVKELEAYLSETFSKQALKAAVKRKGLRRNIPKENCDV